MAKSALLVMDVQQDIVDITDAGTEYLARLSRAIGGARAADMAVIYVTIALPAGDPEVSPRNRVISGIVRDGLFTEGAAGTAVHHDVTPRPGDAVVTKRRGSAFSGSDFDLVLRARDIDSLVVTGIATSGVVLSTLCSAVDRDLGLTVLVDACHDTDPELHRVLTENLFPRWGDVITVEDWLKTLAS
ncbi:cysteine hydrolase [Streptomyces sp. NPDC049967]|uniref:cysteine hydrolase family protein n=1 Tax=unclassified Streptomyces TaxID=2593676 RepID=UPI002E0F6442|nr:MULTISPECIES: cysteine hydrolase [unclassified Streptomyces]WSJ26038.1 cysteine hydrolase [Streptomyces sp. NBC_01324]